MLNACGGRADAAGNGPPRFHTRTRAAHWIGVPTSRRRAGECAHIKARMRGRSTVLLLLLLLLIYEIKSVVLSLWRRLWAALVL